MQTDATAQPVFYQVEEEGHAPGSGTLLGFWIYLMSDALLFATVFATFGVLSSSFAGGPTPRVPMPPARSRAPAACQRSSR